MWVLYEAMFRLCVFAGYHYVLGDYCIWCAYSGFTWWNRREKKKKNEWFWKIICSSCWQNNHPLSIVVVYIWRLFILRRSRLQTTCPTLGKIMVSPLFCNALYRINYRLPKVTSIVADGIYSIVYALSNGGEQPWYCLIHYQLFSKNVEIIPIWTTNHNLESSMIKHKHAASAALAQFTVLTNKYSLYVIKPIAIIASYIVCYLTWNMFNATSVCYLLYTILYSLISLNNYFMKKTSITWYIQILPIYEGLSSSFTYIEIYLHKSI